MSLGKRETVISMLSLEDNGYDDPSNELITNALEIANAQIEGRLAKKLLKIDSSSKVLNTVANWYALAESIYVDPLELIYESL